MEEFLPIQCAAHAHLILVGEVDGNLDSAIVYLRDHYDPRYREAVEVALAIDDGFMRKTAGEIVLRYRLAVSTTPIRTG